MVKHILGMAVWQCICLFVSLFAGEFFIVEPDESLRYDRPDSKYVYPGRYTDWKGEALYSKYEKEGPSRHFTWIFTMFVLMQLFNMFSARKIRDEINIFVGLSQNWVFILIIIGLFGLQAVIT